MTPHTDDTPPASPSVCVVVLHWRGIEHSRKCLASLQQLTYPNLDVLLVDNGSDGYDGEQLKQEFARIALLRLTENFGFSGGCNAGIDYALNRRAAFVWLLNNDAVVFPDTLTELVAATATDPTAGAAGAVILDETADGSGGITGKGHGVIDFRHAKSFLLAPSSESIVACDWLSGSSLLLRSTALSEAGKLDDRYYLYFEDVELCFRIRRNGWRCLLAPKARIRHSGYASTSGSRVLWRYYYGARNRLYFFHENTRGGVWLGCMLRLFGRLLRHMISAPLGGKNKRVKLKGEFLGTLDFVRGRTGRADLR